MPGCIEQATRFMQRGESERTDVGRRKGPGFALDRRCDGIMQEGNLHRSSGRHEWRPIRIIDGRQNTVRAVGGDGIDGIQDAAFVDQPLQCGHLFGTPAEADSHQMDPDIGILIDPLPGLQAELVISMLDPGTEGVRKNTIDQTSHESVLGTDARHVAARDKGTLQRFNISIESPNDRMVLLRVLVNVVRGAIDRAYENTIA